MIANPDGNGRDHSAIDAAMMERCIRLAADAIQRGELPFGTLICKGNDVVVATINQEVQNADVTRHAELIALSEAQKTLGTKDLSATRSIRPWSLARCVLLQFAKLELVASYSQSSRR